MKYFLKKLLRHEIFRSMISWTTNFLKMFVKSSSPPPPPPPLCPSSYILNVIYLKHYSVKNGSVSFFSSSDMPKLLHLLGCHTESTNSLFNSLLSVLRFLNLIVLTKSMTIYLQIDKKSVLIRLKMKAICLKKKLLLIDKKIKKYA